MIAVVSKQGTIAKSSKVVAIIARNSKTIKLQDN